MSSSEDEAVRRDVFELCSPDVNGLISLKRLQILLQAHTAAAAPPSIALEAASIAAATSAAAAQGEQPQVRERGASKYVLSLLKATYYRQQQ